MIQWGEVFNESRNGEEDDGTIFFDAIESLSAIDVEDTSSLASSDEDGSSSSPRPSPPPDHPPKIPAVESESKNQHRDRDIKNESPHAASSPQERCASPLSPQLPPPPPPQLGVTYLGHSPQSAFEELKHDTDIFRGPIPADNTRSDSDFEMEAPFDPSPDTLSYEYEFCTITPFWSDLCTSIEDEDEDEEELCVLESGTSHNPPIGVSQVTGDDDLVMQNDTFSTPAISCSWLPSPLATSKVATSSSNQEFNLESARSTKGSCDTSVTVSDIRQTDVSCECLTLTTMRGGVVAQNCGKRPTVGGDVDCQLLSAEEDLVDVQQALSAGHNKAQRDVEQSPKSPVTKYDSEKQFQNLSSPYIWSTSICGYPSRQTRFPSPLTVLPTNTVSVKTESDEDAIAFAPLLLINNNTMCHRGPIWCMEFSSDGMYLATAGEDGAICIFDVAPNRQTESTPLSKNVTFEDEAVTGAPRPTISYGVAPDLGCEIEIISSKPIRRYWAHTADVVDLSWSNSNFLLSASLDKTVRLWHVSQSRCLKVFWHEESVSSVSFHPSDDQFFVSGCFDKKIRVWDATSVQVTKWAQTPDIVTSVTYLPSEKYLVAGLIHGQVIFYSVKGLKYYTQISAKDQYNEEGVKVTGFAFFRRKKEAFADDNPMAALLRALYPFSRCEGEDHTIEEGSAGGDEEGSVGEEKSGHYGQGTGTFDTRPFEAMHKSKQIIRQAAAIGPSFILDQCHKHAKSLNISPKIAQEAFFSRHETKKRDELLYREEMLVSTNDSRLRLFDVDDYCMIRKFKGDSFKNTGMQIKARTSETGNYVVCGSNSGLVHIWKASSATSISLDATGIHGYDKIVCSATFRASNANVQAVTDTHFIPSHALRKALTKSGLFPTMTDSWDGLNQDLCSSAIITSDCEGSIRVFLRKKLLDEAIRAAGPDGNH